MNRRNFVERVALTAGSALAAASSHAGEMAGSAATSARFDVTEKAVAQLQAAMQAGTINAQQLVQLYLARIAALDKAGPKLNSIIELNPEALAIAKALVDAEGAHEAGHCGRHADNSGLAGTGRRKATT